MVASTRISQRKAPHSLLLIAFLCVSGALAGQPDCEDVTVVNRTTLPWNRTDIVAPWLFHNETTVYSSLNVIEKMEAAMDMNLTGTSARFRDVFAELQKIGCLVYIHGGVIRDAFLNESVKDVDVEVAGCTWEEMTVMCKEKYGDSNCDPHRQGYLVIGKEDAATKGYPLDIVLATFSLYANLSSREFSANSLSYDIVNKIIIDSPGTGVLDACNLTISLPVPEDRWDEWRDEGIFVPGNGLKKLPRYWKMRGKGFSGDEKLNTYIFGYVKDHWANLTKNFRKVYCDLVPETEPSPNGTGCILTVALDESQKRKIANYENSMKNDMGEEWFNENIVKLNLNKYYLEDKPEKPEQSGEKGSPSNGALAKIFIVLAVFGVLVALGSYMWIRRWRRSKPTLEVSDFVNLEEESIRKNVNHNPLLP